MSMQQQTIHSPSQKPEVETPPIPKRNLPEHEIQSGGPREFHFQSDRPEDESYHTHGNKTLEPTAPRVREEAAP